MEKSVHWRYVTVVLISAGSWSIAGVMQLMVSKQRELSESVLGSKCCRGQSWVQVDGQPSRLMSGAR